MNEVKTGCTTCIYNFNGQCANPSDCAGLTLAAVHGAINPHVEGPCVICNKQISSRNIHQSTLICDECKAAIEYSKNKMKEETFIVKQKEDPNGFRITVKEFVQRFVPHGYSVILKEERLQIIKETEVLTKFEDIGSIVWNGKDYLITDEGICPFKDYPVVAVIDTQEKWEGKVVEISIRDPYISSYQKAEQTSSDILEDLGILGK